MRPITERSGAPPSVCPKCQSAPKTIGKIQEEVLRVVYECGTVADKYDWEPLRESDRCKIAVATRENQSLRSQLESVLQGPHPFHNCNGTVKHYPSLLCSSHRGIESERDFDPVKEITSLRDKLGAIESCWGRIAGFTVCSACGPTREYRVIIDYPTLEEAQDAYSAFGEVTEILHPTQPAEAEKGA